MTARRVLKVIGWILLVCFVGFSIYDGYMYETQYKYGSAPFELYVLVRFITFGAAGVLCLIASHFFKDDGRK